MRKAARHEAKLKGIKRYFTGEPCVNGHVSDRQTSNGCCIACQVQRTNLWLSENKNIAVAAQRRWESKNRESHLKLSRDWKKSNPHKTAAINVKRKTNQLKRCPSWLTNDDLWMIDEAYSLAALRTNITGIKWHVDHIIPLLGKNVSGLHVPTNLQVITAFENYSKGNRYTIM